MEKKAIIDKFVEGKPVTFGDSKIERPWKDTIKNALSDWQGEPIEKAIVQLDFSLLPIRFMRQGKQARNDLDNLAKPTLDALVELGVFQDDSGILDLILRKRKANVEGVSIKVYHFKKNEFTF
ncbi:MAG: RusA family crossover junction endodeoxyribonuclease [Nitrosopumilaceae archaeon]